MQRTNRTLVPENQKLVPIAVDLETRQVELLNLEGATYSEPFLQETVERRLREGPAPPSVKVDFESFLAAARRYPAAPDGFIFHVGRCGSTLLANMLTCSGEHLVIKEPGLVSDLIAGWLHAGDRSEQQPLEAMIDAAVRHLLGAAGDHRYKVLKFAAWNIRMAGALLRLFADTPSVFVYRPPAETVASLLFQRPAWFDLIYCPRSIQTRFFPTLSEIPGDTTLSPALLFAHAWRSAAEAALAQPPVRMLLLPYSELITAPADAIQQVLAHFRQVVDMGRTQAMADARSVYSKDPQGRAAFDPAGLHRRPALSPSDQAVVRVVTGDVWSRLETQRTAQEKPLPATI
jgi:hypothetical protein